MKLLSEISLNPQTPSVSYDSRLVLLGSCFAEHMSQKLKYFQFHVLSNPFGILFHPKPIETFLKRSINNIPYSEEEVVHQNERWHCLDAHSVMSSTDKEVLLKNLNKALENTRQELFKATHLVLTLGTSWAYKYKKTGHYVANCHKIPQKEFSRELFSVADLHRTFEAIISLIRQFNRNITVIFTISPVRHLKDGVIENSLGKAHLLSAVHPFVDNKNQFYFPSYELMMDELRDYRFYDRDLIHPNELAIDYIWDRFKSVWIDQGAYPVMEEIDQIQKGLRHKPFNPSSEQHKKFIKGIEDRINLLESEYPFMEFKRPS